MKRAWITYLLISVLLACQEEREAMVILHHPAIYPDYTNVTIPANIAPLNFLLRDSVDQVTVTIAGKNKTIRITGNQKVAIPLKKWKKLLMSAPEQALTVAVVAKTKDKEFRYQPFKWYVRPEPIDPCLSYRLIEPGYEVWNKIRIMERNLESFDERVLADNDLTDGSCMNCHIYGQQDPSVSMFHIRGKNGGTIVNRNGKTEKIDIRTPNMISPAIYGNFHPSGQYGVFSTNVVTPELHMDAGKRLEVYDKASDLIVLDFDSKKISSQPFLSDSSALETFPVFSACGKWIYFCTAPYVPLPDSIQSLRYSICRVAFDARTGTIGTAVDTIWNAKKMNGSASFPKPSPDGRYLLFTTARYGTFPIWHREANLRLIDLKTNETDQLTIVNDTCSDSYHSWSSNSRWFVFASKRDDGIYGKPYFAYIDSAGVAHKPFVLPQADPEFYDNTLKSFNIPELSTGKVPYDAGAIGKIYRNMEAQKVF